MNRLCAPHTLATYGHVIEELEDAAREPAEDVIRKARGRHVPSEFPQRLSATAAGPLSPGKLLQIVRSPLTDSNR